MFSEISELKSIRKQKSILSERESELSAPIMSDLDYIPTIYKWFCEIQDFRDCPGNKDSVHIRKKFIFIILFLYAPSVLAGGRMPKGLRDKIAESVNISDKTFISHNIETVVVHYNNYKDFRKDIEYIYTGIVSRLKDNGIISKV